VDRDDLGPESMLLLREYDAHVGGAPEMAFQTLRALLGELLQGGGDFDVSPGAFDGHGDTS
jgi:hypothetical protein